MVGTSNESDPEMAIDLKSPPINYDTGLKVIRYHLELDLKNS